MGYLVLLVALSISGIAAWYSIVGLAAIFAGAQLPIIVMGAALEIGKLVTASWLYQNWKKAPFVFKSYLTSAVIILMFITSMGIFGFLSKAHIEANLDVGDTSIQLKVLQSQEKITQDRLAFLLKKAGDDPSKIARATAQQIQETQDELIRIQKEKLPLLKEENKQLAEIGPLKYIAELIYGVDAPNHFDSAVRWVIILLIFVFDPLAVLLVIAANMTIAENKKKLTTTKVAVFPDTAVTDIDTPPVEEERIIDINNDDYENMSESDLDLLIKKYRENPKSQREGTFLNMKYKKLLAYKESLAPSK